MPPTPIPDQYGIATIKMLRTGAASPDVVTFGYSMDGVVQSADADAVGFKDHWIANFTAATTINSYTFIGVHTLRKQGAVLEAGDSVVSIVGTVAASATSPAVAVRVTKKTAFAGKGKRGRVFLPPAFISETNIDINGVIDTATLASLQTKCTGFFNACLPDKRLVLLHADGSDPDDIIALTARSTVGTQRRRQAVL